MIFSLAKRCKGREEFIQMLKLEGKCEALGSGRYRHLAVILLLLVVVVCKCLGACTDFDRVSGQCSWRR